MATPSLSCAQAEMAAGKSLRGGGRVLCPPRSAHLIGAGGQGMRAMARLLADAGWKITGSDAAPPPRHDTKRDGLLIATGHDATNLPADLDEVVYSAAIEDQNVERLEAQRRSLPAFSYPEMMARVVNAYDLVAVGGTHGKSTVTAMVAEILLHAGIDPTVVCGAEPIPGLPSGGVTPQFQIGGRYGGGRIAVAEACEYRRHFLQLRPRWATITGIEPDHFDCFKNVDELAQAFAHFATQVPRDGRLLIAADCRRSQAVAESIDSEVETFADVAAADWSTNELCAQRGRYRFSIQYRGTRLGYVRLRVPGRHNVRNAVVAAALAHYAGADSAAIEAGLDAFLGIRRRLEHVGDHRGITIWEDYAHHPTEIAASLATLREIYPERRICLFFQPHQESRTRCLLDPLAESLKDADIVGVGEIFRARESEASFPRATAVDLADRARALGADVLPDHDIEQLKQRFHETCRSGDVLVTMGAGDIAARCHEYTDWI